MWHIVELLLIACQICLSILKLEFLNHEYYQGYMDQDDNLIQIVKKKKKKKKKKKRGGGRN
jgi:hypothetical protein